MPRNVHVTDEVTLEGFQAILEPGKFGYSLSAVVSEDLADKLETERADVLKWAESKLKNPKRATLKPTPWEEVSDGTPVTDKKTPLYGGSTVKLGFYQKPYILRDGVTYGSSLKLVGVQVVSVKSDGAGVDAGELGEDEVADLFGKTKGFKAAEPPVENVEEEEDF